MKKIECNFKDWKWPFYIHDNGDYLSGKLVNKTHGGPGTWEPVHTSKVVEILKKGDVAIDMGANMGWYTTIMAKCVGSIGSVVSIEPSTENFEVLSENIKLNDLSCVKLINKAAGNEKKIIKLSRPKIINYGDTRIYNPGDSHEEANEIEMIDVDSLLKELSIEKSKVRFVKIDCQGAEPYILDGMKETIDSLTPGACILLEIWPESWLQQNLVLDYVFKNIKNKFDILDDDMKTSISWEKLEETCKAAYEKNRNKLSGFDILLIKK